MLFWLFCFSVEEGLYYALDLGGTNLWVLRVQLGGTDGDAVNQEFAEVSLCVILGYPLILVYLKYIVYKFF